MSEDPASTIPISQKKSRISEMLLILTTIFWGTTFIATNIMTQIIPPMFYMGVRYLIATLGFLPLYPRLRHVTKEQLKIGIIAGTISCASFGIQTIGIMLTTATKSAFLTGLTMLMVPIIMAVIYKKRVPGRIWVSILIAIFGVSIMTFGGFESLSFGDILVLISDVLYAVYMIYLDNNLRKVETGSFSVIILAVMSIEFLITSVIFEPIGLIFGEMAPTIFAWQNIATWLYMGLVASVGATLCQNYGQKNVPASKAAIIFTLEPLFATFFAVLFGEALKLNTVIGGIIIVIGVLISIERKTEDIDNSENMESS